MEHTEAKRGLFGRLKRWICGDWYCPEADPDSVDRAYIMVQMYTSSIVSCLALGTMQTGLFLCAGADDGFIGLMAVIMQAMNFVQVFFPLLLERFSRRKKMLIWLRSIHFVMDIALLGLIPLLPLEMNVRLALIAINVSVVALVGSVFNLGANAWHIPFITEKTRTNYYAVINMVSTVVVGLLSLGASAIVDLFEANGMEYEGLLALRGVALIVAAVEIWCDIRIGEKPYPKPEKNYRLRDMFIVPLKCKPFMITVAVGALYNFSAMIQSNYYTVYLLDDLNMSYTLVSAAGLVSIPVYLLLSTPISRWLRNQTVLEKIWRMLLMMIPHWILMGLVNEHCQWLFALTNVYGYSVTVGLNLGLACLIFENLPEEGSTIYIAFYSMIASLSAMAGAAVGREFMLIVPDAGFAILGIQFVDNQLLMFFHCVVAAVAALLVCRLDKRNEKLKAKSAL